MDSNIPYLSPQFHLNGSPLRALSFGVPMAFYDEFLALADKYNVGVPPHMMQQIYQLSPPPAPEKPKPSEAVPGFFVLMGITNPDYANFLHQVKETSAGLAPGSFDRAQAELNLAYANGEWITAQFIGTGVQIEQFTNDVTGQPDYRLKQPTTSLPNTFTWPDTVLNGHDLSTTAGVIAHVNSLPKRV